MAGQQPSTGHLPKLSTSFHLMIWWDNDNKGSEWSDMKWLEEAPNVHPISQIRTPTVQICWFLASG
jgi:hypothetical protein